MLKVIQASDVSENGLFSFIIWKNNCDAWQLYGNLELRKQFREGSTISENFQTLGFTDVIKLKQVPQPLINSVFNR